MNPCLSDRLAYQCCERCGAAQTLQRLACARCGGGPLVLRQASGRGMVYAATVVSRAPAEAFRTLVPYSLVLVTLDEGPRVMGHAEPGLAIGDPVAAEVFNHEGVELLKFRRAD
jgi:uncharacterized protein